jgi:DNA-binding PadR family transcriptional regulator
MPLPFLTHLQFLVLSMLKHDSHSGRFLRERLKEEKAEQSAAAFYQMMARLEEGRLVSGWYESSVIDGQTIKERKYEISPRGARAVKQSEEFYASVSTTDVIHFHAGRKSANQH